MARRLVAEEPDPHGAWRRGSLKESAGTAVVMSALLALQAGLILWWWSEKDTAGDQTTALEQQLLHLLGFLTSCNAVLLITQAERLFERAPAPGKRVRRHHVLASYVLGWGSRVGLAVTLVAWAFFLVQDDPGGDAERLAWIVVAAANALALVSVVATALANPVARDRTSPSSAGSRAAQDNEVATRRRVASGSPERMTVAFSGGGIRAATFALGAWNALGERDRKTEIETETGPIGPRLVAVSGGSYLAASIVLLRQHVARKDPEDDRSVKLPTWDRTYAPGSPEITRLRRHTRDLVEPPSQLLGGLLTLLTGSFVNILVLVGFAWFVAWLLSWLYTTTSVLAVREETAGTAGETESRLAFALPDWSSLTLSSDAPWVYADDHWLAVWLVPTLALLAATYVIWVRIKVASKVDRDRVVSRRSKRTASGLAPVVGLALVYLLAVVGVPWVLFALNQLAVHNAPSQSVASVIRTIGFADADFCRAGMRDSIERAYAAADVRAELNLGTAQAVTAGACGKEVAVSVKRATAGETVHTDEQLEMAIDDLMATAASSPGRDLSTGATALLTLVTTLALAVRRANATDPAALSGWRGKVRKLFTSWLPFAALTLVLGWLLLLWTWESTLRGATPASPLVPVLVTGAGLLAAVVVDANATAVHSYYRQRLSSAWAVGRTPDGGVDELSSGKAYTFSGLESLPLHVVTTANVRAYTEAPTRRGGMPLVFSSQDATLVDGGDAFRVPMEEFEDCAGRGRVSVMAAVATSGAAVSPMAGRYSYNIAPFRLLLTLFNVRVGAWVANPHWGMRPELAGRARPWLIARPGAAQVFAEAMGKSSAWNRWLYLSDGGHLDNTGLVEAVRLHATGGGRIVVVDASNDVVDSWSAVGDALGVIRADLGIDLRCVLGAMPAPASDVPTEEPPQLGWWARFVASLQSPKEEVEPQPFMRVYEAEVEGNLLEVLVVKAVRPEASAEELPEAVRSFTLRTPEFPRSSTTRQDFGDVEFEAYRALGEHYMRMAWEQWTEHRSAESHPSHAG